MRLDVAALIVVAALGAASPARAQLAPSATEPTTAEPEGDSGFRHGLQSVRGTRDMVAAAHPLATAAGREILDAGGSAVDAAIAIQMVLNLVEPQSSGIGGGAFMLSYDHASGRVHAWDGRETAPAAATPRLFLHDDGTPMAFHEAVVGGRSVGVPGVLRMLELAHRTSGRLPWARLFEPAIRLARDGFDVTPRLHALLASERYLALDLDARALYYPDGRPLAVGAHLRNPALATTLERIARDGADGFYRGPIAADVVARVTGHRNPGGMTPDDLAGYRALERAPVCIDLARIRVCGVPPPSSGGIAVAQVLGLLEARGIGWGPQPRATGDFAWPVAGVHWISEAERLAFADRALYVADPAFVPIDPQALLEPRYLSQRAALMSDRSLGTATAGHPRGVVTALAADPSPLRTATTQLAIVDADGNAATMTTTIEDQFGSRQLVDGFLLNNQLTDFSFLPEVDGRPVANRVEAGKRPRSTMSPTLVFDRRDGALIGVLGSPGGSQIVEFVVKTLIGTLELGLDPQRAIDSANFGSRNGPTELERGRFPPGFIGALEARGHGVSSIDMTSGTQALFLARPPGEAPYWIGGADARREGTVDAGAGRLP